VDGRRQQRVALGGGEVCDRSEGHARSRRLFGFLVRGAGRTGGVRKLITALARLLHCSQRCAVGDHEQPGAQHTHLRATTKLAPGAEKCLLNSIFCVAANDATAVIEQQRAVALHDRRERLIVALLRQVNQTLVGLGARRAARRPWGAVADRDAGRTEPHAPRPSQCSFGRGTSALRIRLNVNRHPPTIRSYVA
jgi:hypothetical protein